MKRIGQSGLAIKITQSSLGVLMGAIIALFLSRVFFSLGGHITQIPDGLLDWVTNNIYNKPREKGFYILCLIICPIFGILLTKFRHRTLHNTIILFLIMGTFLLNTNASALLSSNDFGYSNLLLILFFFGIVISYFFPGNLINLPKIEPVYILDNSIHLWDRRNFVIFFFLLMTLFIVIIPASREEVASHIGLEFHIVSFIIGPALYFFKSHLIPGKDYFSQYSLGMGWVFSHFLASSVRQTMINYVGFISLCMFFFYVQLLILLKWLYKAWLPAIFVTFTSVLLIFHCDRHFFDPSSYVLRYPLLVMCAFSLLYWFEEKNSIPRKILLGAILAVSIFLNTETGLIFCIASFLVYIITVPKIEYTKVIENILLTSCCFASILLVIYGKEIFTLENIKLYIQPIILFGKVGFGGIPIHWSYYDLNWLYNLVIPGIVLTTISLLIINVPELKLSNNRRAGLLFFAFVGLMMMFKFVNMSWISLYHINSLGFLIVSTWLIVRITESKKNQYILLFQTEISKWLIIWSSILIGSLFVLSNLHDSRNPAQYGFRSWILYPSVLNKYVTYPVLRLIKLDNKILRNKVQCADFSCVDHLPSARDVLLIQERVKPQEQAAVIDLYDWAYLLEAQRAPLFTFLPSIDIFTTQQLDDSLKRLNSAKYLFTPKWEKNTPLIENPNLHDAIMVDFYKKYELEVEGDRLRVWKKKI